MKVRDLVEANLYEDEDAVIQDALPCLLRSRADLRVRLAMDRYKTEDISLGKAAHLAGVSWVQMRDILVDRGVALRLGADTIKEAREELDVLRTVSES